VPFPFTLLRRSYISFGEFNISKSVSGCSGSINAFQKKAFQKKTTQEQPLGGKLKRFSSNAFP